MKGRVQEKNGYFYAVITVAKGVTPIWRKTGVQSGKKGTRKYNQNKKQAESMIASIIEQCRQEFGVNSIISGSQHVFAPEIIQQTAQTLIPEAMTTFPALTDTARAYRLKRPKIGQDIPFEHAVDLYLKSATSLKGNSLEKYKYAAEHIKSWFGARQLCVSEINALDVTEYFRHKSFGLNDDGSEPLDEKTKKSNPLENLP